VSGPYDKPDDPDDVTLWAGRLRSWPTPPAEVEDDTVRSPRAGADDDTVLVRRTPVADPIEDDTVRSARRRGDAAPAADPVDEDTAVSAARARVAPPSAAPSSDEAAASAPVTGGDGAAGDTATVRRHPRVDPHDTGDTRTVPRRPAAEVDDTGDTATARRRHRGVSSIAATADDTTAGSRRSAADPAPSGRATVGGVIPEYAAPRSETPSEATRESRSPDAGATETYAPRPDGVVRVARTPPPSRHPELPDAAAVRPRSGRGHGRRLLVAGIVIVVLVAAAVVALVLLIG
jgi:hypothetical protein